jgi:hypothetical protein
MAEMIIPGTYIDVRAEGLISAGRIATGIVGVVGTAREGPVGKPIILSEFRDAHDQFGAPDDQKPPTQFTLMTAIDLLYRNGASTVVAVRVEGPEQDKYIAGLDALANETINIVVLAGQEAGTMGDVLVAHLDATAQTDHERIGVIGVSGASFEDFLTPTISSDRLIVTAPGLNYGEGILLSSAYTAAAVAGLLASVSPQTSITNKPLNVPGLTVNFNRGQQGELIEAGVLALIWKNGPRILKGITAGQGDPFTAITTRRTVDYAKYGVRSAADPYIGRLNNARVRAALKATLDAFLTRMVEDEALTKYELAVSASRAQEIAGEVRVVMTIQPTFSIDFINVTMILR